MIQLTIGRSRTGSILVTAERTLPGDPYALPPVERHEFRYEAGESVSEVFAEVGKLVAGWMAREERTGKDAAE